MNEAIERDRTMNPQPHPSLEDLTGFVQEPEATEFNQLRIHVATCSECRKHISKIEKIMKVMESTPSTFAETSNDGDGHLTDHDIINYVSATNDAATKSRIQAHLKTCGACQKAVLKYRSHTYASQSEVEDTEAVVTTQSHQPESSWQQNVSQFKEIWLAWLKTPTVALTGVLAGVLVTQWYNAEDISTPEFSVATYQDEDILTFTPKGSPIGAGFFSTTNQTTKPFTGIEVVTLDKQSFKAEWPAVSGATSYTLRLFIIDNGIKQMITEQSTNIPQISVTNHEFLPSRRYEWQLEGETQNEQFQTRGGFVLHPQDK